MTLPTCQLCGTAPLSEAHAIETQRRWNALTRPDEAYHKGWTEGYYKGQRDARASASGIAAPLDVERLSDFFHEEYWLDSPHRDRGAAEGSDCEVCWRSADRLITLLARLTTEGEGRRDIIRELARDADDLGIYVDEPLTQEQIDVGDYS